MPAGVGWSLQARLFHWPAGPAHMSVSRTSSAFVLHRNAFKPLSALLAWPGTVLCAGGAGLDCLLLRERSYPL